MRKQFFAGANTCIGYYSLFTDIIKHLDRLFILKGGPGTGKSTLLKRLGTFMEERRYMVYYLQCSLDAESLDGVIFPELSLGVVDGTAPHVIDPKYPGVVDEIINLNHWDVKRLLPHKESIIQLTDRISNTMNLAFEQFENAKVIHDEWEGLYLGAFDFKKANDVANDLISQIFSDYEGGDARADVKRYFFGAATAGGYIHFIDSITDHLKKRYIIKGRPGSGKSTLMKKIGREAERLGLTVEYYPCGFDPNSIDMVIIPSLSVALFDGTAPHVIEPTRETDEVVDMFALCIDQNVESKHQKELLDVESRYKEKMSQGVQYIKEAKALHDELEKIYISAMDFDAVNLITDQLIREISDYAEK